MLCSCWSLSFICCAVNEVNLFRKRKIANADLEMMLMTW
jgi:hypothetical protein